MSEEIKKERTVEDIKREFVQMCARVGEFNYQISAIQSDIDLLYKQMRDLNLEAAALKGAAAKGEAA